MDNFSCSQASNDDNDNAGPSKRRNWSSKEEKILIERMKDLIEGGWRVQNGFKTGYQKAAHKLLKEKLPNTDLTAENIKNKIVGWKRYYGSLYSMYNTSGFEWDEERKKMVFLTPDIWNAYVQGDSFAKCMKNKSFPLFRKWGLLFGKDKATGQNMEDADTAEDDPLDETNETGGKDDDAAEETGDNDISTPINYGQDTSKKRKKNKGKQVADTTGEKMVQLMGKFCEETNANLQAIGNRIGYEVSLGEKREKLYEAIGELGVLTTDQQILIAKALVNNNKDLELFFSLPHEARARMVLLMATGNY